MVGDAASSFSIESGLNVFDLLVHLVDVAIDFLLVLFEFSLNRIHRTHVEVQQLGAQILIHQHFQLTYYLHLLVDPALDFSMAGLLLQQGIEHVDDVLGGLANDNLLSSVVQGGVVGKLPFHFFDVLGAQARCEFLLLLYAASDVMELPLEAMQLVVVFHLFAFALVDFLPELGSELLAGFSEDAEDLEDIELSELLEQLKHIVTHELTLPHQNPVHSGYFNKVKCGRAEHWLFRRVSL